MERRSRAILQKADDGGAWLMVKLDHMPNLDHIETVSGSKEQFYVDWELADTRRVRKKQRRLFFALLNDIVDHFVVPQDFLKDMFYLQYQYYTGKEISLADHTRSSVTDANVLIELVVDFMFEWHVPFKKGYELLPKEEQYFIYQCCRHRVCLVCGLPADIHHVDTVGMGSDRNKVDHMQHRVLPLCRTHHQNYHQLGPEKFSELYHVPASGIKLDAETLKKIKVKGKYQDEKNS